MIIHVGISGALGKMGQTIAKLCLEDSEFQIKAAIERSDHKDIHKDYGTLLGINELGIQIDTLKNEIIKDSDVIIDFSSPDNTIYLASLCKELKKPMVIGTTGLNENQMQQLETYSKNIPIVYSPNMSLGVNVLFYLVSEAAKLLKGDFEVEITEIHHSRKKDSPSGTAEKLKNIILENYHLSEENTIYGRKGIIGERGKNEVGVHAIRGGDVVGEHTVYFFAEGERLEFTHKATSRTIFARGAIKAAKWIINQQPGLYSMNHVLGIKK